MKPPSVPYSDLTRLLADSRESTILENDELAFLRTALYYLSQGIDYSEALHHVYAQLGDQISGE